MGAASPMFSSLCQYCKLRVLILAKKLLINEKLQLLVQYIRQPGKAGQPQPANWGGSLI